MSRARAGSQPCFPHSVTTGPIVNDALFCSWARVPVDDDDGDFNARQRDRDDFLGWKTLLEVVPHDGAARNEVVRGVTLLMNALIEQGLRVLAQAAYVDELPGGGEIVAPGRSLA